MYVAVIASLFHGFGFAGRLDHHATTPKTDAHPSFEVATIKPALPNEVKGNFRIGSHRIFIENQSVANLVSFAYSVHPKQIVNGPAWIETEKYDIEGQAEPEGVPNLRQIQEMVKKLLADRYKLKIHSEQRELPIYALVMAKSAVRIKSANAGPNAVPTQTGSGTNGQQVRKFTNNSMAEFALGIQPFLDRPVVDHTGLDGRYSFVLKWTPDESTVNSADAAPGLFTAIQEQLGLKFEPTKGLAEVLVIESVDHPTEN